MSAGPALLRGVGPGPDSMRGTFRRWPFLGAILVAQAGFVVLNVVYPGWALVDLDAEHNIPTYFQAGLLALASLSAAYALFVEAETLGRRPWALLSWAGAALLFAAMACDEALVLHEEFNGEAARAWFRATSPVQGTVVWLVLLSPVVVGAMGGLLAWILSRRVISRAFMRLGLWAVGLWLLALTLEGTAKSVFIPLNLYRLEVALEESAEALAPAVMCLAIWIYVAVLWRHPEGTAASRARWIRVPWLRVAASTLIALGVPAVIVAASVLLNPAVRLRAVGDEHLRAARVAEAAATYRVVVARAPRWARAWDRLGVAEYRLGNLAQAGEAFATAARLSPRDASMAQHVGVVLYQQGRYGEAAAAFQRSVALQPGDPDTLRNLAAALARIGRAAEAETLRARASAIAPESARVIAMRVSFPADLALAYLSAPGLEAALSRSRSGDVATALAAYRALIDQGRSRAAAHLGAANELVRWQVALRLTAAQEPIKVPDADLAPVAPTALFTDWIRRADGQWEAMESVVAPPASGDRPALTEEARRHYERALSLGAGAAARLGLAALALERGDAAAAAEQIAAARSLDPTLPPAALSELAARAARR